MTESPVAVSAAWMPPARMQRIIVHWTAGAHKASDLDKAHYHILIQGDASWFAASRQSTSTRLRPRGVTQLTR